MTESNNNSLWEDEIDRLRLELAAAKSVIQPEERQFILDLLRDARLNGILEIEYKALKLSLSPLAAEKAHQQSYAVGFNGSAPTGWETTLPKAR